MDEKRPHNIPEQTPPDDINPTANRDISGEEDSIASPFVTPADVHDESDRPLGNPVTGGAL